MRGSTLSNEKLHDNLYGEIVDVDCTAVDFRYAKAANVHSFETSQAFRRNSRTKKNPQQNVDRKNIVRDVKLPDVAEREAAFKTTARHAHVRRRHACVLRTTNR